MTILYYIICILAALVFIWCVASLKTKHNTRVSESRHSFDHWAEENENPSVEYHDPGLDAVEHKRPRITTVSLAADLQRINNEDQKPATPNTED